MSTRNEMLAEVCEYTFVKNSTRNLPLMLKAQRTGVDPLVARQVILLVGQRCGRLAETPRVQWGERNWARPSKGVLNLNPVGLCVETVLHELAHIYAPPRRENGKNVHHHDEYVAMLDLLLDVWASL